MANSTIDVIGCELSVVPFESVKIFGTMCYNLGYGYNMRQHCCDIDFYNKLQFMYNALVEACLETGCSSNLMELFQDFTMSEQTPDENGSELGHFCLRDNKYYRVEDYNCLYCGRILTQVERDQLRKAIDIFQRDMKNFHVWYPKNYFWKHGSFCEVDQRMCRCSEIVVAEEAFTWWNSDYDRLVFGQMCDLFEPESVVREQAYTTIEKREFATALSTNVAYAFFDRIRKSRPIRYEYRQQDDESWFVPNDDHPDFHRKVVSFFSIFGKTKCSGALYEGLRRLFVKRKSYTRLFGERLQQRAEDQCRVVEYEMDSIATGGEVAESSNVSIPVVIGDSEVVAENEKIDLSMSSTDIVTSFSQLCDRWFPIDSFVWKATGLVQKKYILPKALFTSLSSEIQNSLITVPFSIFYLFHGGFEVMVTLNSHVFQYGQLQVAGYYQASSIFPKQSYIKDTFFNSYQISQMNHAILDAGDNRDVILKFPYNHPLDWIPVKKGSNYNSEMNEVITIVINQLVPLVVLQGVQIAHCTVFVKLVDARFSGSMDKRILNYEMDVVKTGVRVANKLLNQDMPTQSQNADYLVPTASHSWSVGKNIVSKTNLLSLENNVNMQECPSETQIKNLACKYGLFAQLIWQQDDALGKKLFGFPAMPLMDPGHYHVAVPAVANSTYAMYNIPPIGVVASAFCRWRGRIKYKFHIACSGFHSGRFMVAFVPGVNVADEYINLGHMRNCQYAIIDIKTTKMYEFITPYLASTPIQPNYISPSNSPSSGFTSPQGCVVGFVLQPLAVVGSDKTKVFINVYMAGHDDIEFAVPSQPCLSFSTNKFLSANANTFVGVAPDSIWFFGKADYSYKQSKNEIFLLQLNTFASGLVEVAAHLASGANVTYAYAAAEVGPKINKTVCKHLFLYQVKSGKFIGFPFKYEASMWAKFKEYLKKYLNDIGGMFGSNEFVTNDYKALFYTWKYGTEPAYYDKPQYQLVDYVVGSGLADAIEEDDFTIVTYEMNQVVEPGMSNLGGSNNILYGESFDDLKDYFRRYHYIRDQTIDLAEAVSGQAIFKFPVLPSAVSEKPDVGDPIMEYIRDNPITVLSSGFRYYRGNIRYRFVMATVENVAFWVQHRPDINVEDFFIVKSGLDVNSCFNYGYAYYVQQLSVNPVVEIEIPYYALSRKIYAHKSSGHTSLNSLGAIVCGLFIYSSSSRSDITIQIFQSIGDNGCFSMFQGYPPMMFNKQVIAKVTKYEMMSVANMINATSIPDKISESIDRNVEIQLPKVTEAVTAKVEAVVEKQSIKFENAFADIYNAIRDKFGDIKDQVVLNLISNIAHCVVARQVGNYIIAIISFLTSFGLTVATCYQDLVQSLTTIWTTFTGMVHDPSEQEQDHVQVQYEADCTVATYATFGTILWQLFGLYHGRKIGIPKNFSTTLEAVFSKAGSFCRDSNYMIVFFVKVMEMVKVSYDWFVCKFWPEAGFEYVISKQQNIIGDWCREVMYLLGPDVRSAYEVDSTLLTRLSYSVYLGQLLIINLEELVTAQNKHNSRIVTLTKFYEKICTLRDELYQEGIHPNVRRQPFLIWVYGDGGIGKSSLYQTMSTNLLKAIQYRGKGNKTFTLTAASKWWNNCNGQPCVYIDDFLSVFGQELTEQQLYWIYLLKTNAVLNPPLAELKDKKMRYAPELVYINANISHLDNNAMLADSYAFHRRRDALVKARFNLDWFEECKLIKHGDNMTAIKFEEICKEYMGAGTDKVNSIAEGIKNFDHLEFYIHRDPTNPQEIPTNYIPFSKFNSRIRTQFVNYFNKAKAQYETDIRNEYEFMDIDFQSELDVLFSSSLNKESISVGLEELVTERYNTYIDKFAKNVWSGISTSIVDYAKKIDIGFGTTASKISKFVYEMPLPVIISECEEDECQGQNDDTQIMTHNITYTPKIFCEMLTNFKLWMNYDMRQLFLTYCDQKLYELLCSERNLVDTLYDRYSSVCDGVIQVSSFNYKVVTLILTELLRDRYRQCGHLNSHICWIMSERCFVDEGRKNLNNYCQGECVMRDYRVVWAARVIEYTLNNTALRPFIRRHDTTKLPPLYCEFFQVGDETYDNWYKKALLEIKLVFEDLWDWLKEKLLHIWIFFKQYWMLIAYIAFVGGIAALGGYADYKKAKAVECRYNRADFQVSHYTLRDQHKVAQQPVIKLNTVQNESSNQQLLQTLRSVARNTVYIKAKFGCKELSGRCLGIKQKYVLILRHYVDMFKALVVSNANPSFYLVYTCLESGEWRQHEIIFDFLAHVKQIQWYCDDSSNSVSSFGLLEIQLLPCFKDISGSFVDWSHHGSLGNEGLLYARSEVAAVETLFERGKNFAAVSDEMGVAPMVIHNCYTYGKHGKGMCGTVLISKHYSRIIGMHVAGGDGVGISEILYREMFNVKSADKLLQHISNCAPVAGLSVGVEDELKPSLDLDSAIIPIGIVDPGFACFESGKTAIYPSLIHDFIPHRTEPSPLSINDPRLKIKQHPKKCGCEKHGDVKSCFDYDIVHQALEDYQSKIMANCRPLREVGLLTIRQVVEGIDGLEGYDSLNLKTSEGYPLVHSRPSNYHDKSWLFKFDDQHKLIGLDERLVQLLELESKYRSSGIKPSTVFVDCMKDYRIDIEKCKYPNKTRIFSISPIQFTIASLQYMGDFRNAFQKSRYSVEHAIGINTFSDEWTELANKITSKGHKICCGDYSNFGPTLEINIVIGIFKIIYDWYDHYLSIRVSKGTMDVAYKEKFLQHVAILSCEMINSYHLCNNFIYSVACGLPSGTPFTAPLNCCVNSIYIRCVYCTLARKNIERPITFYEVFKDFDENVVLVTYGDDLLMNVSEKISAWFNTSSMSTAFAEHLITFTDASKSDDIVEFDTIETATFLKSHFIKHPHIPNKFLPGMNKTSIEDCCNWVHLKFGDLYENTVINCESALRLAFGWGPVYYTNLYRRIQHAFAEHGKTFKYKSWEELNQDWLQGDFDIFKTDQRFEAYIF